MHVLLTESIFSVWMSKLQRWLWLTAHNIWPHSSKTNQCIYCKLSLYSVCLCQNCLYIFDWQSLTFEHRFLRLKNASIANRVYLLCAYVETAKTTLTDSLPLPWLRAQSSKTNQCIYCKLSLYSLCLCRNCKDDFDWQPTFALTQITEF